MDIDVGTVLAGKYELVQLLGRGAMGEVWRATHDSLGGDFAVKIVETVDDIEAETASGRFQLEAQIAAKLSRKTRHIVSVSDHGEERGLAYIVMELLEGTSLDTRVKKERELPLPEVAAIVIQVCRALSIAHEEGVFHRDLKPANILLTKDEDGRLLVKLLDFGIARATKAFKTRSPFVTSKDMVLGTPSYMSPEQARGLDNLDHRCDLWALATCAFEALAGRIPFEGKTVEDVFLNICTFQTLSIRDLRPDLSEEVEAFFRKAFTRSLDERFSSALELATAFEDLVPPSSLEPFLGPVRLSPSGQRLPAATPTNPELFVAPTPAPAPPRAPPSAPAPTGATDSTITALDLGATTREPTRNHRLVIGGAIAAAAVALAGAFAMRGAATNDASAATNAQAANVPAPPSATPPPAASAAAREEVPAPSEEPAAAPDPSAAPTSTTASRTKPAPKTGPRVVHRGKPAAASAPTATPSKRTTPPAAPQPTTTTTRKVDKGEVF